MYEVKVYHFKPCTRRGDLEEELVLEDSIIYKTKKIAKDYIECILSKYDKKQVRKDYRTGNEVSNCYYFTGKKWQNENSGEIRNEYYQYQLKKI